MDMNALRMLIASVSPTAATNDDFDVPLAVTLLRYESILSATVTKTIGEHMAQLSTKQKMRTAMDIYDADYLLNLPLPYSGIQKLCTELSGQCKGYGLLVPQVWRDFADGQFNWADELETLAKGGAF